MTKDEIKQLRERWAKDDLPITDGTRAVIVGLLDEIERQQNAMAEMAYNWRAHSAFSTIDAYVTHYDKCAGGDIACACGATQSKATFEQGRRAIDAFLPPGDQRAARG